MDGIKNLAPLLLVVALAAGGAAAAIVIPTANSLRSDIGAEVRAMRAIVEKLDERVNVNGNRIAVLEYAVKHALEHDTGTHIADSPTPATSETEEPG